MQGLNLEMTLIPTAEEQARMDIKVAADRAAANPTEESNLPKKKFPSVYKRCYCVCFLELECIVNTSL